MKTILLVHGPNLNLLGQRDHNQYGAVTLASLEELVATEAEKIGYDVQAFQSNHEGALIGWIQEHAAGAIGMIINPGALTHYSYALYDCLLDSRLPIVEVHLSNINNREDWRKISVTAPACVEQVTGKKEAGYSEAVELLHKHLSQA